MAEIYLGTDKQTGEPVFFPVAAFNTHVHMPGATGKGKTTAMLTMICQILLNPHEKACHLIVDFLGGMTNDLLLWMASDSCPQEVRDRLVLIKPAREGRIISINPLIYDSMNHGFFRVNRATELILRAWDAQSLAEQPRLARWLFNAFWACAQVGLTIADTRHIVMPGSEYHRLILDAIPEGLRLEWEDLLGSKGGEAVRVLDSTRNRMKPFYDGVLHGMFASEVNRFDTLRFMREKKIVVLCLTPENRLSPSDQNTIAGMTVNEFLATARSLPSTLRYPTYLWLDEFQRMVTPDLELAIPEVRQLGIKLILAHQSFSQLRRGNCDLTSLIWQPQTRLAFGEQGEDADLLAQEFASITYDPKEILNEIYSWRQLETGKSLVELKSWSTNAQEGTMWGQSLGKMLSNQESVSRDVDGEILTRAKGGGSAQNEAHQQGGSRMQGAAQSTNQQLVANLATIRELSNQTYYSFEQKRQMWARDIRNLRTGSCMLRLVDDESIRHVKIEPWKPGCLSFDMETIEKHFPELIDSREKLLEVNFQQDMFVSPEIIERETHERLERVLRPKIALTSKPHSDGPPQASPFNL